MRSRIQKAQPVVTTREHGWIVSLPLILLAAPASSFAQVGGDRVTSFLSNALTYAQGLGIFAAGFLVIWAVANVARERPSGKQWAGAAGALLLSSLLQLLRTFAG